MKSCKRYVCKKEEKKPLKLKKSTTIHSFKPENAWVALLMISEQEASNFSI